MWVVQFSATERSTVSNTKVRCTSPSLYKGRKLYRNLFFCAPHSL